MCVCVHVTKRRGEREAERERIRENSSSSSSSSSLLLRHLLRRRLLLLFSSALNSRSDPDLISHSAPFLLFFHFCFFSSFLPPPPLFAHQGLLLRHAGVLLDDALTVAHYYQSTDPDSFWVVDQEVQALGASKKTKGVRRKQEKKGEGTRAY